MFVRLDRVSVSVGWKGSPTRAPKPITITIGRSLWVNPSLVATVQMETVEAEAGDVEIGCITLAVSDGEYGARVERVNADSVDRLLRAVNS